MKNQLMKIEKLKKFFTSAVGSVRAVDGIDLKLKKGEVFGLVGESGCGKSTLVRTILRLIEPDGGRLYFKDREITYFNRQELRKLRKEMSLVFQDPQASLNPRMTVYDILARPLKIHKLVQGRRQLTLKIAMLLKSMGLQAEHMIRFPHELSGGQRQRIGIARALAVEPEIIFLDEPTSALDVSVQTRILKLLARARRQHNLTYFYISHDINLIRLISNRIGVMYLGKIVEIGDTGLIYNQPVHPYTKGLFQSVPEPNPDRKLANLQLRGEVPSPTNPPSGCNFHPRCLLAADICRKQQPKLKQIQQGRRVACHLFERR
ncbi:MAG: ABC transporter ATP-binding protein [Bacillota bacterium]